MFGEQRVGLSDALGASGEGRSMLARKPRGFWERAGKALLMQMSTARNAMDVVVVRIPLLGCGLRTSRGQRFALAFR